MLTLRVAVALNLNHYSEWSPRYPLEGSSWNPSCDSLGRGWELPRVVAPSHPPEGLTPPVGGGSALKITARSVPQARPSASAARGARARVHGFYFPTDGFVPLWAPGRAKIKKERLIIQSPVGKPVVLLCKLIPELSSKPKNQK